MKKLLSLVLACAMLLSMSIATSALWDFNISQKFVNDEGFILGDVNEDGKVDAKDALYMKANIAGLEGYKMNPEAADIDANEETSAKDFYYMKRVLSGLNQISEYESVNGRPVQLYKLTIGNNDISNYTIVLNETATDDDNCYFAALNFKKYVEVATGVDLPIVFGEAEKTTSRMVRINQIDLFSEEGQELGVEGMKFEVKNGDLYIYGTYRGTMYSVFEILETYLGFRFYSNDATYVYKARCVDIPEGTVYEYTPKLVFRHACQTYGSDGAFVHYFANGLNGTQLYAYDDMRYGTLTGPIYSNAHSFYEYWKMATGTYPENSEGMTEAQRIEARFASGTAPDPYKWQPCATSDEEYDMLFEGMLLCNQMSMNWGNDLHYKEGLSVFSFSILDNQNYHSCRNCRKIAITNGEGYSGLYLQMYNRAVVDIQEYYPGLRLYGIVYAKDFPKTIKPHDNLVILYCGVSCDNHILGQEECYESGGQLNGMKNDSDMVALEFWGNLCRETGAELWFWVYPVNYHYYLAGCPNIPNLYYNTKYLIEEYGINGIYYEGGGTAYNFEALKAYVSAEMLWNPDMSYEEFVAIAKEFLYIYYGDGYEELWEYILMQTEAGDRCGTCFINNFDRPGDMYSYEYLGENYEYMRDLLESAYEKVNTDDQKEHMEQLLVCCDFMGLSSVHTDWYTNGENVDLYCERYNWMYNYIKDNEMEIFSSELFLLPPSCVYDVNPMTQFYNYGSRRDGVYP